MRRKFIAKNKKNFSFFTKIFLFIILGVFVLSKILSFKLFENNTNFIMHIMENSNHLIETELSYNDKINDFTMLLMDSDVKNPVTIFQNKYIYEEKNVDYQFDGFFKNISKKINNINITNMVAQTKLPKVYIYNTHQTEEYVNDNFYNLTPTVYTAAELLKDKLEQKGITTIVENGNVTEYLNNNNLNYDDSYIASRYYLEQAIIKYPSVELFIDFHRDALSHDIATVQYNGKNYAKILFVVGLDHNNYAQNLEFTKEINNLFLENYSFLTRGILEKSGPLVNGVYNQDLSNRIILLEVGGHESNFEEVENTIELISEIICKKVGDKNV